MASGIDHKDRLDRITSPITDNGGTVKNKGIEKKMDSDQKATGEVSIYVDIDDVLAESTLSFLSILEQDFGKIFSFDQITDFDLKKSFHLTDLEYEQFFYAIHQPETLLGLEPIEDAIHILEQWQKHGYRIVVVTGRLTDAYESSLAWLAKHKIPCNTFIMLDKYSRPGVDRHIALSLQEFSKMRFTLAVEDSLMMARFLSNNMNIPVALMDRPWNQTSSLDGRIVRCHSWQEVKDMTATLPYA
jgi:uncharacterized HAD superfamily protein